MCQNIAVNKNIDAVCALRDRDRLQVLRVHDEGP